MPNIDFAAIKAAVSLQKAAEFLGLELKPSAGAFRCACPQCEKGGDRGLVITPGKGFYCFGVKKGGDVISLVAHVRDIGQREAAEQLFTAFMQEPEKPKRKAKKKAPVGGTVRPDTEWTIVDYLEQFA